MKKLYSFKFVLCSLSVLCFLQPIAKTFASEVDDEASSTRSKKAQLFYDRGNNKYLKGNLKGAISDYTRAINLNSSDAISFNNRCHVKYELKQYNSALEDCNKAISINDKFPIFYNTRGDLNLALGNKDLACEDYKKSVALNNLLRKKWLDSPEGLWCRNKN